MAIIDAHCLKRPCFAEEYLWGKLQRRTFDGSAVELFLQCAAPGRMIQLCQPDSYKVED